MTALRKILVVEEEPVVVAKVARAPFIGLAYIVALLVVGLVLLAMMGARAAIKIEAVKTFAMFVAAPSSVWPI